VPFASSLRVSRFSGAAALSLLFCAALSISVVAHDDEDGHGGSHPPYDGPGWDGNSEGPPPISFPANGIQLLSWIPVPDFGDHNNANDCWGYVSPSGREYAILGLQKGTAFVEVTNPSLPEIIGVISGPTSLWRDAKVYQHYCYVVTEGTGAGIQVIDMGDIDNGNVTLVNTVNQAGNVTTTRTHNVAINEESGYLYRCGGGSGTIGLRVYSLANPASPQFVGEWHNRYVHDAQIVNWHDGPFAGREIAFLSANNASNGGNPALDILDVTDKTNMVLIGQATYSWPRYAHQNWLTEDRQYVLLNDELAENYYGIPTTTRVIDVSDLTNPFEATTFTNGNTAIGHNIYTLGNLSLHANYRSGLRVFDISDPLNAVEIGYFDTWPQNDDPNFNSLWSNYPYFPSGTVIGSDIEKGLFVWSIADLLPDDESCVGDLNDDGVVNVADLLLLFDSWGPCPDCEADLNGDDVVNVADLLILFDAWGECPDE
jgi:choice-of-anchor B domain-containing protein